MKWLKHFISEKGSLDIQFHSINMAEGPEEQVWMKMETSPNDSSICKSSSDPDDVSNNKKCDPKNEEKEINDRSVTTASKLGNGDCFHNPENLVQFVVSGKSF